MPHPDLILTNANIITLDPATPRASALAIHDGQILAVGHDNQMLQLSTLSTRRIDLLGKTVVPGFTDAHIHFLPFGLQLLKEADLVGTTDIDDLLSRLTDLSHRVPTGWLRGHGFDPDKMRERRFPTRQDLDRVSTTRPILISRICGHAVVANSAALALASEEQRQAGNEHTGLYTEEPAWSLYRLIPPASQDEMEQAILAAAQVALRTGITSVHAMLNDLSELAAYQRLRDTGRLPLRVVAIPPYPSPFKGEGRVRVESPLHKDPDFADDFLRLGPVKIFSDGSLGAHTALLSKPYHDAPSTTGIRMHPTDQLKRMCSDAHSAGFQLAIHAIGDQAVRETLDALESALAGQDNTNHRHRIEHASLTPPDCLERMARLKIVVTAQPQFVTSDTWTPARIGPGRVPWAYPFRSMIDAGIPLALSSDCPVERLDAFACLSSAINRHPWSPHETLTPESALRAYCLGGPYAAHIDDRLGSLVLGKLADFVILPADPTQIAPNQIATLRPTQVFIAGREASQARTL